MLTRYYSGDQIKDKGTGESCSMYVGEEMCIEGFGKETEGKTPFGIPALGGKIILKWSIKKYKRTAQTGLTCLRAE